MERPEKLHLEEPLEIGEHKITYTEEGLKYMIHSYEVQLSHKNVSRTKEVELFMLEKIEMFKTHLQAYELQPNGNSGS